MTPSPDADPAQLTEAIEPTPSPTAAEEDVPADAAPARPAWLGTRVLPLRADGFGQVLETPAELRDRRLPPPEPRLPDPPADAVYAATVDEVPAEVLARSTWHDGCPVDHTDLRYLTVSFWGFDDRPHTGELLVHVDVADELARLFGQLFEARFPIEEMRVVRADELELAPTGDGNNTTAFVCRAMRGSGAWSEHASGLAVDINPFHNPYVKHDLVLPELASAYVDRHDLRPGMLHAGDVVVTGFESAGWAWGGRWSSLKDYMHLSTAR